MNTMICIKNLFMINDISKLIKKAHYNTKIDEIKTKILGLGKYIILHKNNKIT